MPTGKATAYLLSGLVVLALAAGGYWLLLRTAPENCRICKREIHAAARAVVEVDGRPEPVCCVRCALTLHHQQHKPVRVIEVTDYVSNKPLRPEAAYYVEGSRVVLCEKHEPLFDPSKQPYPKVFDRCEPSIYAFGRLEDAEGFAQQNGGMVLRPAAILQEAASQP